MIRFRFRILPLAALALPLTAVSAGAHQADEQPGGAAEMHVNQHDDIGKYLVDRNEMSVYLFEADTRGTEGTEPASNCYEQCAQAWPPLLTDGQPKAHEGVDPELLGTMERKNGDTQVTYNGWPLYYFASDQSPGHVRGHDIEMGGGEWYLIAPDGEKAGEEH